MFRKLKCIAVVASTLLSMATSGQSLPAITYQGRLMDHGSPADGAFDFTFTIFDMATGGAVVGSPFSLNRVNVNGGYFTATLDFGQGVFNGQPRWLQIAVAPSGLTKKTVLSPRQQITPVPYAVHALNTETGSACQRTRIVSTVAGLREALSSIIDADAERRYLIRLEPGWYDLQTQPLRMRPFVDIEGAGPGSTVLTGITDPQAGYLESAVVIGADDVNLRGLTIQMQPNISYAIGLLNHGASMKVSDVSFTTKRETQGSNGYAILNRTGAFLRLDRVHIDLRELDYTFAETTGIWNQASDLETRHCDIAIWYGGDEYGILNEAGWFLLDHTTIEVRHIATGVGIACYGSMGHRPVVLKQSTVISADYAIETNGVYNYELDGTTLRGRIDIGSGQIIASDGATQRVELRDPSPNVVNGYPPYEYSPGHFMGNHVQPGVYGGTIAGGGGLYPDEEINVVTGHFGTISGGRRNQAGQAAAVSGGAQNEASGLYSTVPGGYDNNAAGQYSFAGGSGARALHDGSFVWAGKGSVPLASTAADQFLVSASGGFGINAVPDIGSLIVSMPGRVEVTAATRMGFLTSADLNIISGGNGILSVSGNMSLGVANNHVAQIGGTVDHTIGKALLVNAQQAIRASAGNSIARLESNGDILLSGNDISLTAQPLGDRGSTLTVKSNYISLDSHTNDLRLYLKHLPVGGGSRTLTVNSSGEVIAMVSSERYKSDVQKLHPNTNAVLNLEPVRFKYTDSGKEDVGLIAERVDEHVKDLVIYDNEGRPDAVKYDRLSVYILEIVKELKAENRRLKVRVDELEKRLGEK